MTTKKKNSAFMKPMHVSAALAEITGKGPYPRTEITKLVWDYIKKNKLQSTKDKRKIKPDAKLAKVFGSSEEIDMFKMTAKISKHITDKSAASV